MAKKKTSVRLLQRGDVVRLPDGSEDVIREVQVVLQLANGSNVQFGPTDSLEILPREILPELSDRAEVTDD